MACMKNLLQRNETTCSFQIKLSRLELTLFSITETHKQSIDWNVICCLKYCGKNVCAFSLFIFSLQGKRGSVVVKGLCYKPESIPDEVIFKFT
jgi:hypothetical protein